MKSISKIKITGLALGVAAFIVSNVMAVPQSKQYPEYRPSEAPAVTEPTRPQQQPKQAQQQVAQQQQPKQSQQQATQQQQPKQPVVTESKSAYVAPAPVAGPVGSRFDSNLITVEKILVNAPGDVGADYQYIVRVTALTDVQNVSITEHLPEGVTYVGSSPDVAKSGNDLNWGYARMNKGERQDTTITVRPNREGDFLATTKVCVDPALLIGFRAGMPRLAIEKYGPADADLGSKVNYTVKVTNVGTAPAKDVVIVDTLPEGLRGSGDTAQPTIQVGTLAPNESKTVTIPGTAASQGTWVNKAVANASNAASVAAEARTTIGVSRIKVTKTGPDQQMITRPATYNITVANEGTTTLENVTVTDDLPKGARLMAASDSPVTQNDSQVVWTVSSIAPSQAVTRNVTLTANEPMTTTNRATARTGKGLTDSATATTIWEGPPGVLTEIIDNVDPIRVGAPVTYTIRITNQGAYRELDARIRVLFSDEITPLSVSDSSAVLDGKVVTLPTTILKPRGVITFTIQARGAQEGVATTRLEFNSSFLPKPINKDETTYVY